MKKKIMKVKLQFDTEIEFKVPINYTQLEADFYIFGFMNSHMNFNSKNIKCKLVKTSKI